MKKHITDEKTGISYTLYGDYYLPDLTLPAEKDEFVKKCSAKSMTQISIVKVLYMTPKVIITVTTFRNETVNVRIPFEVTPQGMESHNKTGG